MPLSLYNTTVPVFIRSLTELLRLIEKGRAFARRKNISEKRLIGARLAPDMLTFAGQVQYSYFTALDAAAGLSGKKAPAFAYDETSVAELARNVRRTLAYLHSITPRDFSHAGRRRVPVYFDPSRKLPARRYITQLALPNFFFHMTAAYAILRHIGVPLKKSDYLGKL
ncbi:DUF1993 domain-containing protein [Patescibacteria group bacterium]|nr:DUF1993 domain-containing protein [Patescibacteria group bacterium]